MMIKNLKLAALNSLMWNAVEKMSGQALRFILTIVIARLVSPADFGLIAMLSIFLSVAQSFIDCGFYNALVQKQDRTEVDYSTMFYSNVLISVIVYFFLYWSAPYIASFYSQPELKQITRVMGVSLIISAFRIVQQAKLVIALNFRIQAVFSVIAVVVSGLIGIYMAYHQFGVWALVVQSLVSAFISTVSFWIYSRWMPLWTFSIQSFQELFSFGSKLLLAGVLHTIYSNLYTIVIGRKFSSVDLGFFSRGQTMAYFVPSNMTNIVTMAMYPILCSIQDDYVKLKKTFKVYIRLVCFIFFPIMIILAVLSEPIIKIVLTDKWLPSVFYVQILCIAYMWDPLMRINANILSVVGRTDYSLKSEIIKKVISVIVLFITIPFGIDVMCIGLALYCIIDLLVSTYYVKRIIGLGFWDEMRNIYAFFILSLVIGGVVFVVNIFVESDLLKIFIGTLVGIGLYISMCIIFRIKEVFDFWSIINSYLLQKK
ncbi:lipopolysaccharide biosynthesis protein [Bacteroides fragilis]|nr:lipopolysaccharide biosynthesis protein [Bacteroides fragilis]